MPVCAWVDGEYGIAGVYLGVEAEIGRAGVRRVVEGDLTESELAGLKEAAEAVRAKQADVQSLWSAPATRPRDTGPAPHEGCASSLPVASGRRRRSRSSMRGLPPAASRCRTV